MRDLHCRFCNMTKPSPLSRSLISCLTHLISRQLHILPFDLFNERSLRPRRSPAAVARPTTDAMPPALDIDIDDLNYASFGAIIRSLVNFKVAKTQKQLELSREIAMRFYLLLHLRHSRCTVTCRFRVLNDSAFGQKQSI